MKSLPSRLALHPVLVSVRCVLNSCPHRPVHLNTLLSDMLILLILLDNICRYFTHHYPVSHRRCLLQVPVGQIQHSQGGDWWDSASAESGHGLFSTAWVGTNCKPLASRPRSSDVGWPTVMSSIGASLGWLQNFQWRMRLRAYCASYWVIFLTTALLWRWHLKRWAYCQENYYYFYTKV